MRKIFKGNLCKRIVCIVLVLSFIASYTGGLSLTSRAGDNSDPSVPTVESLGWGLQNTGVPGMSIANTTDNSGVTIKAAANTYYKSGLSTQKSGTVYSLMNPSWNVRESFLASGRW